MKKELMLCIGAFLLGMGFVVGGILPSILTQSGLERAANLAKAMEVEDGHVFEDIKDWWKTSIRITCGSANDGRAYVYTAVSAGKDRSFGTDDDLSESVLDLNKSRIVGEYAGKKATEFIKGWTKGRREKGKFPD